ncbi:MAG: ABC-2 family transporter protein [Spirochaetales bacterium]|nr:ABC-2 family transporter protein [Spirochaetales bacterium]
MVKRLFYYWRIYRKLTSQHIKSRMSFRADFLISVLGMLALNVSGFLSLLVLFNTIPSLGGWDYYEMLFLYGFFGLAIAPVAILFDKFWSLWSDVIWGNFINCCFKPLNTMFYYLSDTVDLKSLGSLAVSVAVFVYALPHLRVSWTALKVVCLVLMYLGSVFSFIGIRTAVSATAFWMGRNVSVMNFFSLKVEQFVRYPLTIFGKPFQIVFVFVIPYAFVAYMPVNHLLHSPDVSPEWFLTPLVGAAVFGIGCLVWSLGVRRYNGTGT